MIQAGGKGLRPALMLVVQLSSGAVFSSQAHMAKLLDYSNASCGFVQCICIQLSCDCSMPCSAHMVAHCWVEVAAATPHNRVCGRPTIICVHTVTCKVRSLLCITHINFRGVIWVISRCVLVRAQHTQVPHITGQLWLV